MQGTTHIPRLKAVETGFKSDQSTQVGSVQLTADCLVISVTSQNWAACVQFEWVHGFRVLDECDLSDFWQHCSLLSGWVFEVHNGGWKELELQRPSFISGRREDVKEYLIIGLNECVSVLSEVPPSFAAL